jgi:DNA-binding MarR family transcriptional regulator
MPTRSQTLQEIFEIMDVSKRSMHGHFQHVFESLKLSPSQIQLLMVINIKQPISHKALASKMQLTPGAISQLLDGLADGDYITRTQSQADRRINYLSITKAGKRKLAECNKLREQIFTKAFTTLTDAELESYLAIQQKMLSYFDDQRLNNTKN